MNLLSREPHPISDEEATFDLYNLIAKPNELTLSTQVYETYESVIKPLSKGSKMTWPSIYLSLITVEGQNESLENWKNP